MSVKSRIAELNSRLADTLTAKGVQADAGETTTELIGKVADIPQGGDTGIDLFSHILIPPAFDLSISEVTEDITLHMERAQGINGVFDLRTVNAPKVTVYVSDKCTNVFRFMRRGSGSNTEGLRVVEIIGDTSKITQYAAAFVNRSTIQTINCEFDFSSATNVAELFSGCSGLVDVRFKTNTLSLSISFLNSSKLSAESVKSIIDGLADLTGGTSQTLTLNTSILLMLTDEQYAVISGKNWNVG